MSGGWKKRKGGWRILPNSYLGMDSLLFAWYKNYYFSSNEELSRAVIFQAMSYTFFFNTVKHLGYCHLAHVWMPFPWTAGRHDSHGAVLAGMRAGSEGRVEKRRAQTDTHHTPLAGKK